jgi:hypothetical protein
MASWIVHLRIAESLLKVLHHLNPTYFAVGNIAPDSGVPDEKWENFDPPYWITHFCEKGSFTDSDDLAFYSTYIHVVDLKKDTKRRAFLWGYFCHLVTDSLWNEIRRTTHQQYKQQFEKDPDFIWEVKRDWYGLDFCYLNTHPDCLFRKVFVKAKFRGQYLDFLPESAIQEKVKYICNYYQRDDKKNQALMNRPFLYLTKERMDEFVVQSSDKIADRITHLEGNS